MHKIRHALAKAPLNSRQSVLYRMGTNPCPPTHRNYVSFRIRLEEYKTTAARPIRAYVLLMARSTACSPSQAGDRILPQRVRWQRDYAFFIHPVDPVQVPGYADVITNSMGFCTMTGKVTKGKYRSLEEFTVRSAWFHSSTQTDDKSWSIDPRTRLSPPRRHLTI